MTSVIKVDNIQNSSGTAALSIDSSGNVGINTSNPNGGKLHVTNTTDTIGYFESTQASANVSNVVLNATQTNSSANATFQINSGTTAAAQIRLNGDSSLAFHTGTSYTERMRIGSGGGILINTTSAVGAGGPRLSMAFNGSTTWLANTNDTNGTSGARHFTFHSSGSEVGRITTTTSATTYTTTSDHRLKENVTADWDATTRLKQLNPVRFNFIVDADNTVDGFLAHEVQGVVPEAVDGTHNEVDDDGNPVYQGIDQSKLVPLLVKAIQELEARITALEAN